ncbi:E3 ubiquitin-protein ligase TRIM21 [Sparus aurata]|uniref:E3 ubiquitin-protein ligase TRIM21 n=1 Tax=Sparus aurata TaxID=8175 RepID=UPI0011C0D240|nr:E3 ubiquitin-protein ligase TRIM21-like [Sparus aurata]
MSLTQTFASPASPAVTETNDSLFQTPQHSYPTATNVCRALDFNTGPQQIQQVGHVRNIPTTTAQDTLFQLQEEEKEKEKEAQRQLKTFVTLGSPASPLLTETNDSLFQTPQHSYSTATNVRRALDFNTGPQQIQQHVWNIPTTTAQDTLFQTKEEEKEKEREAQRQLKARQDSKRADLQQKIQRREQKMTEVRLSVTASTDSLDAEWQEINNVFSEVMRVMEDAWRKALQPLEERRQRVEREAQDLFQTLQNEIDKLRETIDELDQNPDLQVSPLKGVDESRDWRNVTVDGSFSPGTLRSTTSDMMEQIQQKLEKLSSVELRRVATFAVDVKLDPTTAHSYLVLSPDGKKVKDGDQDQKVPAAPGRFDMFGSVLGLNRLTSGRSYWEVEVTRKTGWDLGVARCDANRKGNLSLTPDNGYWVTVHYENEKYAALTVPPVSLSLTVKPQKVGVFVDYDEGLVSFYNLTAQSHIYSFTRCSFGGEISPYFSPHLHRNGKNSEPLIISAVKNQK